MNHQYLDPGSVPYLFSDSFPKMYSRGQICILGVLWSSRVAFFLYQMKKWPVPPTRKLTWEPSLTNVLGHVCLKSTFLGLRHWLRRWSSFFVGWNVSNSLTRDHHILYMFHLYFGEDSHMLTKDVFNSSFTNIPPPPRGKKGLINGLLSTMIPFNNPFTRPYFLGETWHTWGVPLDFHEK